MDDGRARVLILGAYSNIGRTIVKGVLEQTACTVIGTGRNRAKLDLLAESVIDPRLSVSVLDALDLDALSRASEQADIVVNCVGPYIMSGYDIAKTVIAGRRHYVDFAFEQFHYRKLQALDTLAKAHEVALITGAGETVGISSILCARAVETLPDLATIVVCFLEGTMRDSDTGYSSFMNGALEPALGNQDYVDGRYVVAKMGADIVTRVFPEPHGAVMLLSDPSIDSLIIPEKYRIKTIKNYFGLGMRVPFGFFPLMRLLNPYRNRIFYTLTGQIVRRIMRKNHAMQAQRKAPVREPLLTVDAQSKDKRTTTEIRFRGHFNGTAILPILICAMLARGEVEPHGLQTAADIVTPSRLFKELERYRQLGLVDWTITEPRVE